MNILLGGCVENNDYVRLVISDLHLGSFYAKEELLCKMLNEIYFDELVLAGDIIDFIKEIRPGL